MGSVEKVGDKGRVVIPKEVRERLNIKKGQKIIVDVRGNEVVIRPAVDWKTFSRELAGCIKGAKIDPMEAKKIWKFKD